jgi:hypothetical protein
VLQHATTQARAYAHRLQQPDDRQSAVAAAQRTFNALEPELRADEDGKAELHAQADDLQDALWAFVDRKREACELELHSVALSGFAQHTVLHLLNALLALAQAEADRCVGTVAIVNQYYAATTVRAPRSSARARQCASAASVWLRAWASASGRGSMRGSLRGVG